MYNRKSTLKFWNKNLDENHPLVTQKELRLRFQKELTTWILFPIFVMQTDFVKIDSITVAW